VQLALGTAGPGGLRRGRHRAAAAGFDDAEFHDILVAQGDPSSWPTVVTHRPDPRAEEPFDAWRASSARIDY